MFLLLVNNYVAVFVVVVVVWSRGNTSSSSSSPSASLSPVDSFAAVLVVVVVVNKVKVSVLGAVVVVVVVGRRPRRCGDCVGAKRTYSKLSSQSSSSSSSVVVVVGGSNTSEDKVDRGTPAAELVRKRDGFEERSWEGLWERGKKVVKEGTRYGSKEGVGFRASEIFRNKDSKEGAGQVISKGTVQEPARAHKESRRRRIITAQDSRRGS
jgi:hypothetical protein